MSVGPQKTTHVRCEFTTAMRQNSNNRVALNMLSAIKTWVKLEISLWTF
jgi:hypothetical protein